VAEQTFKRTEKFERYEILQNTTKDEVPREYIKNADWKEASPDGRGWFTEYMNDKGEHDQIRIHFNHNLKCWTEVESKSNREHWAARVALSDLQLDISDQEANPELWKTLREPEQAESPKSHQERALTGGSLKSNPEEIMILDTAGPDPLADTIGQMTTDEQSRS